MRTPLLRSSASRRRRFRITWRWWATSTARCSPDLGIPKRSRRTGARGAWTLSMPVRWRGRWRSERELALLFRRLATLRTDIALFDDVDELEWHGPKDGFEAFAARLDGAGRATRGRRKWPGGFACPGNRNRLPQKGWAGQRL